MDCTQARVRIAVLTLTLSGVVSGCFYLGKTRYVDIARRPSEEWSSRDILTVMLEPISHNLADTRTHIKVIATPYFPAVLAAINRTVQRARHLDESEFRRGFEHDLYESLGLYYDWGAGLMVDGRGNYVRSLSQIDSLAFLITFTNTAWPCNSVIVINEDYTGPLFGIDHPCYIPDITDLENRILLVNEQADSLRPLFVWGKERTQLTMEETLLVKFQLRRNGSHFLNRSKSAFLMVTGFDENIRLRISLELAN